MNFRRIQQYCDRPWYPYLVGVLTFSNNFLLVFPSDAFLISAVLVRPTAWVRAFVIAATGSSLGGLALAALIEWNPEYVMHDLFPWLYQSAKWSTVEPYIHRYGGWALGLVAAVPAPQVPAVVIAALAGVPLHEIFLGLWLGRLLKWGVFAWCASHAPALVARFIK